MEEDHTASAAEALTSVTRILNGLNEEERGRVVRAIVTFFHIDTRSSSSVLTTPSPSVPNISLGVSRPSFSTDNAPSPKQFLLEKQPKTDVERIACLAFYLTYFRDSPHFKTLDLAKLNTEAAQPKFSNTAFAATNAANAGYLAPALKGMRQLSAAGEEFVRALPDRESAKAAMARARPRKILRRPK
jgi:hypothetical protein